MQYSTTIPFPPRYTVPPALAQHEQRRLHHRRRALLRLHHARPHLHLHFFSLITQIARRLVMDIAKILLASLTFAFHGSTKSAKRMIAFHRAGQHAGNHSALLPTTQYL
jgi:hypothetical protein